MFRVGQKVVCVDAKEDQGGWWDTGEALTHGAIYTIRAMHIDDDNELVLRFYEIERTLLSKRAWERPDLGYGAFRFRPLVERKTDIGFAHEILRKVSRKQTERA